MLHGTTKFEYACEYRYDEKKGPSHVQDVLTSDFDPKYS